MPEAEATLDAQGVGVPISDNDAVPVRVIVPEDKEVSDGGGEGVNIGVALVRYDKERLGEKVALGEGWGDMEERGQGVEL